MLKYFPKIIKPYRISAKKFHIFTEMIPGFISFLMETLLYFYSATDLHLTFLSFITLIHKLDCFSFTLKYQKVTTEKSTKLPRSLQHHSGDVKT